MTEATSLRPSLPREMEVLVQAARLEPSPERVERFRRALAGRLDWDDVMTRATRHALLPLLHVNVREEAADLVPKGVVDDLRDRFAANAHRNLSLVGELLETLDSLEGAGVPAVPYKGPVLAMLAYGDLSLRRFVDLDLLIPRPSFERAAAVLRERGYEAEFEVPHTRREQFKRTKSEMAFLERREGRVIELEWNIAPRYFSVPIDMPALWGRLDRLELGGRSVPTLGVEDLLVVLCIHGSKHLWERVAWIADVAHLVEERPDLDWHEVARLARAARSERMVHLGLYLARELLDARLPEEVRGWLLDPSMHAVARDVCGLWKRPPPPSRTEGDELTFHPLHLKMREHASDRARHVLRLAVTPTVGDWERVSLPQALGFLYYLVRPVRLASKYGIARWRRE